MSRSVILVTGATGQIGRHLVQDLKIEDKPFKILTRDDKKARRLLGPAQCVIGDLSKPNAVENALIDVDAAFLLSTLDPELARFETAFIRHAQQNGVKRLVMISALGADAKSSSALLRWHAEAEEELRHSQLSWTVIRPAMFYQNFINHAPAILRGHLVAAMGLLPIAMIDARDVARVALKTLCSNKYEGATLTLTGPQPLTYIQVAEIMTKTFGRPVAYNNVEAKIAEQGLLNAGMPAWRIDALLGLAGEFRDGKANLSTDTVLSVTGRQPVKFEEFLKDYHSTFS